MIRCVSCDEGAHEVGLCDRHIGWLADGRDVRGLIEEEDHP